MTNDDDCLVPAVTAETSALGDLVRNTANGGAVGFDHRAGGCLLHEPA